MTIKYAITKGIPIPEKATIGPKPKYPFGKMEIGDSFPVHDKQSNKIRSAAKQYGGRHGMEFLVRKGEIGLYRCWRTA